MVTEVLSKASLTDTKNAPLNIRRIPRLPTERLRTKSAANAAIELAQRIADGTAPRSVLNECDLFKALHVCAYWATRRSVGGPTAKSQVGGSQPEWADRWKLVRDYLIEQNLGLIYSIGSRFRSRDVEWDDVRGEAFYALVRAVEGFNPWFGFRFSTYACNAIRRALIHLGRKATQYRCRFPVEHDPIYEQPAETDVDSDLYVERLSRVLDQNLAELTDREVTVLDWRFPKDGGEALTLGEVGEVIGLSKERVRQIQKRALSKLREVLDGDPVLQ